MRVCMSVSVRVGVGPQAHLCTHTLTNSVHVCITPAVISPDF